MTITVQRIVDLMEHYGSSGAFMSRLCGKSRTLVASWQAGKSVPTASDIATIAARYGVSEAYLRGEVDFPESNLSALQRRLMDSTHDLTDDEMRKVIEYVRFVKFLREYQKDRLPKRACPRHRCSLLLFQRFDVLKHPLDLFRG